MAKKRGRPRKKCRCGMPKDTHTQLCSDCLHKARANKYRSYGRDDLAEEFKEPSYATSHRS